MGPNNNSCGVESKAMAETSSNSPSLKPTPKDSSNVKIQSHSPSLSPSISSVEISPQPTTSAEIKSNSPSLKPTPKDSSHAPSLSPSISSVEKSSLPTTSVEISSNSPSLKPTPKDSSNVDIQSYTPSLSPSIPSVNSPIGTDFPSYSPSWQQPTNPNASPIYSPTTLRPTMLLEPPTMQAPNIKDEYDVNLGIALVVIATPMLIIAGCFLWRWYNERKFAQNYRDFEINAFSHADADAHEMS